MYDTVLSNFFECFQLLKNGPLQPHIVSKTKIMMRWKFDEHSQCVILKGCGNTGAWLYSEYECNEGTGCTVNRASHTSVTLTHACCLQSEAEWKV